MTVRASWWPKDAQEQDFQGTCKGCRWPKLCEADKFCWTLHKSNRKEKA